jgi:transcriptional regulator with XRE-family HTH domain
MGDRVRTRRGLHEEEGGATMPSDAESGSASPVRTLAGKLELLRELKTPQGDRPASYETMARQISEVTGVAISGPYLWELATGKSLNPRLHHLEALAKFFRVPVVYLTDDAGFEKLEDELALLAALQRQGVQRIELQGSAEPNASWDTIQSLLGRLHVLDTLHNEEVRTTVSRMGALSPGQSRTVGSVVSRPDLVNALHDEAVREIALRSSGLSTSSQQAVLTMIEQLTNLESQRTDVGEPPIDVRSKQALRMREAMASGTETSIEASALPRKQNIDAEGIDKSPTDASLAAGLALPIDDLQFTVRSYNCLKGEGIHSVGELAARSEADLLNIRKFGAKSIDEVKAKLASVGLTLKGDPSGVDSTAAGETFGAEDGTVAPAEAGHHSPATDMGTGLDPL